MKELPKISMQWCNNPECHDPHPYYSVFIGEPDSNKRFCEYCGSNLTVDQLVKK